MLVFCEKLMPKVLRIYATEDWSQPSDFEGFNRILDACVERGEKVVILFSNPNPSEHSNFPPFSVLMVLISKLFLLKPKLRLAVKFNIIHLQDEEARDNVNLILQYYTPANTTHVVETKEEAADLINSAI
tara:strand:- start:15522 stop:15911 length:390 start_codon:yes stop_codon:yes gene_type:complete